MVSVHAVEKKKKGRVLEKYTWLIHLAAILGNFDTVKLLVKVPPYRKKKKAPSPPPPLSSIAKLSWLSELPIRSCDFQYSSLPLGETI